MIETPFDNQLSYVLAAAHRMVSQSVTKRLKNQGIQIEAWRIMECLEANDQMTMGDLARIALLNPPTLSKMVDRMVSDGLVHRQIAQRDQRQVNLLLTDLGRSRMLKVRQEVEAHDRDLIGHIDADERRQLIALLKQLTPG